MAGFHHEAVIEYEGQYCTTLRKNRPHWNVLQMDIRSVDGSQFTGADLLAAGVPCPPFSVAGKQLGADDTRDMFPAAFKLVEEAKPRAVLFENVPGFAAKKFSDYRAKLISRLHGLGYQTEWKVLEAQDFGVPQLRPRFVLVALRPHDAEHFVWPIPFLERRTVGIALLDLMAECGWLGAEAWAELASKVAPTLVGGSKLHGGPDLGPTRARQKWAELSVDGRGIADAPPGADFPRDGMPRLTLRMAARVQSFPDSWAFTGGKTAAYRQIGNAFPPNVAKAVGLSIRAAFERSPAYPRPTAGEGRQLQLMEQPRTSGLKK